MNHKKMILPIIYAGLKWLAKFATKWIKKQTDELDKE